MTERRRWLQFSLRGFLVVLTAGCIFSGWAVDRAQKQRAAVEAIEAVGGVVLYDWQGDIASWDLSPPQSRYSNWGGRPGIRVAPMDATPSTPAWLRQHLGEHLFQEVNGVIFRSRRGAYSKIRATGLISVSTFPNKHATAEIEAVIPHLRNLPRLRAIYLQAKVDKMSMHGSIHGPVELKCPHFSYQGL
jgi:hypothetical protein